MDVGAGLYMYDVVVKSLRSLSHLLMSFLLHFMFHMTSIYSYCVSRKHRKSISLFPFYPQKTP